MSDSLAWLEARSAAAPPALRQRVREHYAATASDGELSLELTEAARRALRAALDLGTGRTAALDLLAADALVTMALQARAERDPASLVQFARAVWSAGFPA